MLFFLCSLLFLAIRVRGDLPVHCLRHQIPGEWEFTLTKPKSKRPSCGHWRPDSEERQPSVDFIKTLQTTTRKFVLQDPDVVKDGEKVGTWTMVYDEGFEVAVDGWTYFAFSRFELIPDNYAENGHRNISHCDQTEVGWYHDANRSQWGCYIGKRVGAPNPTPKVKKDASLAETRHHRFSWETESADKEKISHHWSGIIKMNKDVGALLLDATMNGYDEPLSAVWHQSVADKLNLIQKSWTAHAYAHLTNKTARSMNKDAGIRRNILKNKKSHRPKAFLEIGSLLQDAPTAISWRNKDGQSYLDPIITQGDCGSCYSISTLRMLSARNRVRAGNPKLAAFSITFPLYCSEYNQGCGGGYGFLESKWSEDVGLIPESCAQYVQSGTCQLDPGCDLGNKRYRAVNHRYVGGFYGASEAATIASELASGGPLVMSFEPKEDFMYYQKGIYQSVPNKIHQEWEQVDHAVLLVGYGDEKGKKYWLLQNSWGTDWGEVGFFRMLRGQDESGCESIVVAAEVVEETHNHVLDDFITMVKTF